MAEDHLPLTRADREWVFRKATSGLSYHYSKEIAAGMTDAELENKLVLVLGIFGGSCGPDRPCVTYKGSGLNTWGSWGVHNHVVEKPLFSGKETIAMARYIYDIADPEDDQISLF